MIKLRIEGDGGEIVALIQALQGGLSLSGAEQAPLLEAVDTEPDPGGDKIRKRPYTEEQVKAGWTAFSTLVMGWSVNFGPDEDPEKQPDRMALLDTMLRHFSGVLAFIHSSGGLTKAVKTVAPDHWTRAFCRQIAENIVSVSSAAGVSGLADTLRYDEDYYEGLIKARKGAM